MTLFRVLASVLALLAASSAWAASMADRSPFTQGHWWFPSRAGSGFELFNTSDQAMVIWYTYDESNRPVWYTAQGTLATHGTQSWPLLKHRWANGRKADFAVVGSLRLTIRHAESAQIDFDIGGRTGSWPIQPFVAAGTLNEVDHTGSWFDAANPGWGMTVTEQGDVLGGVLYTYDAAGAPTWAAGFDRGRTDATVELHSGTGACPSCTYRPSALASVGRIGFEFRSETDMTVRNRLSLAMADGVNIEGAKVTPLSRPASWRAADRQLAAFADDAQLKAFLEGTIPNILPIFNGIDFSASPPSAPAVPFSSTNLQEVGVDEADVVKTDGRFIYTYEHDGNGVRLSNIRVARIVDDTGTVSVVGTVPLKAAASVATAGLYLHQDNLVAVFGSQAVTNSPSPWGATLAWQRGVTQVEVLDTKAGLPASMWRVQIDGHPVSSRRIGDRLYVVTRFVPFTPGFVYGATAAATVSANEQLLRNQPLGALLPAARVNGAEEARLLKASSIYVPPQGARPTIADFIVVTAIDLANPRIIESVAIVGGTETMYASPTSLVLATSRFQLRSTSGLALPEPALSMTELHQLRLDADRMQVIGSTTLEGFLSTDDAKAPFRLSEYQGRLRAITSSALLWNGTRNRLTILEPSTVAPGLLKTVSMLPNAKRPESLGKPNEQLYATRFMGDRLYAVTFPRTANGPPTVDPLYVVDLGDSTDPRIAGELIVPGFSEYLHPLPNGLMLGFGREASETTGATKGLQLSLYDVRDAGKPREVQKIIMGRRGSESALLQSHHAFSILPRLDGSASIAIPVRIHDGIPSGAGDFAMFPWLYSGLARFELQGSGPADMRLQSQGTLISHTPSERQLVTDPGANGGRSVLLPGASIYIGNGRFWRQDAAGAAFGPT